MNDLKIAGKHLHDAIIQCNEDNISPETFLEAIAILAAIVILAESFIASTTSHDDVLALFINRVNLHLKEMLEEEIKH